MGIFFAARQSCRVFTFAAVGFRSNRLIWKVIPGLVAVVLLGVALGAAAPAHATTAIGKAIQGQYSVDSNGAANYTIPLDIPAGPHGLTPKLALTYNSQSGPGLAGYGWTLSGLSAITRCGRTIAQDGQPQPITFNDWGPGDDYCLDGQKLRASTDGTNTYRKEIDDLSLITSKGNGGGRQPAHGPWSFTVQTKDGLTYQYGATADSEIYAVGAGFSYSSCTSVSPVIVRVWALSSITDRAGNTINFTYDNDTGDSSTGSDDVHATCTGDYWIKSITYGGNGTPAHTIKFLYDDMTQMWPLPADVKVSYRGGAAVGHTQRLNGINIYYGGNTSATISYALTYNLDHATNYSLLSTITECAIDSCTAPTNITWNSGVTSQTGWSYTQTSELDNCDNTPGNNGYLPMDALGQGYDVVMCEESEGTDHDYWYMNALSSNAMNILPWQSTEPASFVYGIEGGSSVTSNGNGIPFNYFANGSYSLLQMENVNNLLHFAIFSPGTNFPTLPYTDYGTPVNIGSSNITWWNFVSLDINGDGYDDVLTIQRVGNNSDWGLVAYVRGGSGLPAQGVTVYDSGENGPSGPNWAGPLTNPRAGIRVADFDGDGRGDLLTDFQGNSWLALVNGPLTAQGNPQLIPFGQTLPDVDSGTGPIELDVNGDGLTDVAYVCAATATTCTPGDWVLAVATGSGSNGGAGSSGSGFDIHDTGKQATNSNSAMAVDWEGDGHQDIMYPSSGDWYVLSSEYYPGSNGQPGHYGFSSPSDTGLSSSQFISTKSGNPIPLIPADLNGDGAFDLFGMASSGNLAFALHNPSGLRMTSITDGLGNNITINYSSISGIPNSGIYTPAPAGSVPANAAPYPGPLWVVSSYSATSGANNYYNATNNTFSSSNADPSSYTVSFAYQGAARDLQGRGFLGFQQITQTDSRVGEVTVTTYDQRFPWIGKIDEQTVKSTGGTTQLDTVNSWAWVRTSGTPSNFTDAYFPYAQTTTVSSNGSGGHDAMAAQLVKTVKTTNSYDTWGNLLQSTIDTNLGQTGHFEENIISQYWEDNVNWCLSLPAHVTMAKSYNTANTTQGTTPTPGNGGIYGNQARETDYVADTVNCRITSKTVDAYESGMSLTTKYVSFDGWGNVAEEQVWDSNNNELRDTLYSYAGTGLDQNAAGQFVSTFADGVHPTSVTYTDSTNGVNLQVQQTWDQTIGTLKTKTDANNNLTTQFSYDGFGRKNQEIEPDGTSTTYTYLACAGGCSSVNAAYNYDVVHHATNGTAGSFTRIKYDSFGREVETSKYLLGAVQVWQDTEYNSRGLTAATSVPYTGSAAYWTATFYDAINRPTLVIKPSDQSDPTATAINICYNTTTCAGGTPGSALQYAVATNASALTNGDAPASETTVKIYDSQGNVVEADDAAGGRTLYSTDAFGEVITVQDPAANLTHIDYDSLGHKVDQIDPDMGGWSYKYDALGELISQTDADNNTITQAWDKLGRMISRTEPVASGSATNVTYNWHFDSSAHCVGKLGYETNSNDFTKTYNCDAYGRPSGTDTVTSGTDYNVSLSYDSFGRVAYMLYPSTPTSPTTSAQLQVNYTYDSTVGSLGYTSEALQKVADSTATYWQGQVMDQFSHYTGELYGNNVLATTTYDQATGLFYGVQSGVGTATNIQDLHAYWDGYGNMEWRKDKNFGSPYLQETFQYDSLNRLTSAAVTGDSPNPATLTLTYSATGAITNKSDVGAYTYQTGHANRLKNIGSVNYTYDNNGSLTSSSDGRTVTLTGENKPQTISDVTGSINNCDVFSYDPDGARYRDYLVTSGSCSSSSGTTTLEIGDLFEVYSVSGTTPVYRIRIQAAGKTVAIRAVQSNGTATVNYILYDHLGSVYAVVDSSANVQERMSYDSFGQRRIAPNWNPAGTTALVRNDIDDRGYTDQYELDSLGPVYGQGLVHMNGRVYDPRIGRFISADPRIENPYNGQALNRYAYVDNNPLNSTDPSGFTDIPIPQDPGIYIPPEMMNPELAAMQAFEGFASMQAEDAVSLYSGSNTTGNPDSTLVAATGLLSFGGNDPATTYVGGLEVTGSGASTLGSSVKIPNHDVRGTPESDAAALAAAGRWAGAPTIENEFMIVSTDMSGLWFITSPCSNSICSPPDDYRVVGNIQWVFHPHRFSILTDLGSALSETWQRELPGPLDYDVVANGYVSYYLSPSLVLRKIEFYDNGYHLSNVTPGAAPAYGQDRWQAGQGTNPLSPLQQQLILRANSLGLPLSDFSALWLQGIPH